MWLCLCGLGGGHLKTNCIAFALRAQYSSLTIVVCSSIVGHILLSVGSDVLIWFILEIYLPVMDFLHKVLSNSNV